MKTLLLVAHGSRRAESNQEVLALAASLDKPGSGFDRIDAAFLELAEPLIPDGLRAQIAAGATEIVVFPYFLSAGRHVVTDVPGEVESVAKAHPEVDIRMAPYLGIAEGLAELMLDQVRAA